VAQKIVPFRAVLITLLLSSLASLTWLTGSYQKICPPMPNEQVGAIYPLDERGRFVYLTVAQHRNMVAAQALFIALWLCTVVVEVRNGWQRRANKRRTAVTPE